MNKKLTIFILFALLFGCGSEYNSSYSEVVQVHRRISATTVKLCPGLEILGWGGSNVQGETGLIVDGKLLATIQDNDGNFMGQTIVPSSVRCDAGVVTCNASNTVTVDGVDYHGGTGNFATVNSAGGANPKPQALDRVCAFRSINNSETRTLTVQRLKQKVDGSGNTTSLKPASNNGSEVLDSVSVTY